MQNLDVSHNRITDDGVLAIRDCLISNNTLCKLNVAKNNFTIKGINKLVDAIQVNTAIQELDVSHNQISKDGVMRILEACTKNRTLHKLVCKCNNISKLGSVAINEYISKEKAIQIFDASWNSIQIDTENCKLAIKTNFQLFDIENLMQKDIESDNFKEELECLDEMAETDYMIELLCYFFERHLNEKRFCLQSIKLSTSQVKILSNWLQTNNTVIHLQINCFSTLYNDALLAISNNYYLNTFLQKLDLSSNNIADDGVFYISSNLKSSKSLCELLLFENFITDKGAEALADAIKVNATLQELNVSKNFISKKGVMKILEACNKNKTVHKLVCIFNNLLKSELAAIREYIKKEEPVKIFDASYNAIVAKDGVLAIKTMLHAEQKSQADDQELYYDTNIVKFNELCSECNFLQCYFEEYLNEPSVSLQDIGLKDFEIVMLSDCLKRNKILTDLNLSNNYIIIDDYDYIFDISSISCSLKSNNTLCKLKLSENGITDKGAKDLADAIQVNPALQELDISKNQINKKGMMKIVEACTKSITLHKLVCTHNRLIKPGLSTINDYIRKMKAMKVFKASWNSIYPKNGKLNIKTTVQVLQLNDNKVYDELSYEDGITESQDIDEFLFYCKYYFNIHNSLTLRCVTIKDFEAKVLCECLESNEKITNLTLSMIHVKHTRQEFNATLQKLDISCNAIGDEVMFCITDSLKRNKTLKLLNLSENYIGDTGAVNLAQIIQVNTTLQEMDISKNWVISKKGIMKILEACTVNKTLHKLVCTHNNLWKSGLVSIDKYNRKENAVYILEASWNTICTTKHKLAIETNLESDDNNSNISNELWFLDEIAGPRPEFLHCCFEEYCKELNDGLIDTLSRNINDCEIEITFKDCASSLSVRTINHHYFQINGTCIPLTVSTCIIFSYWLACSTAKITINTALRKLDLSHDIISDDGILVVCGCLKINNTLQDLNLSRTGITDKGAKELAKAIQVNKTLQKLNISNNIISKVGVMKILEACTKYKVLCELVCKHINLTKSGLKDINEYIENENAVQILDRSWNSMHIDKMNNKLVIKTNL